MSRRRDFTVPFSKPIFARDYTFETTFTIAKPLVSEKHGVMPENTWSTVQSYISSPWFGILCGFILSVICWKMNATWANWLLVFALAIIVCSIFRANWIASQEIIPRILWTLLFGTGFALIFWYCLWTNYTREINKAEVADTTKFQEAFIIDMYNDISASTYRKGEVFTMMTTRYADDPSSLLTGFDFQGEIGDLVARGVVAKTKVAQKKVVIPDLKKVGVQLNNVFLTKKGEELAKDLIYIRLHPKLNVSRPQE